MLELLIGSLSKVWRRQKRMTLEDKGHRISEWLIIFSLLIHLSPFLREELKEGKISVEKEKTAPAVTTKFLPLSESHTLPHMLGSKMHVFSSMGWCTGRILPSFCDQSPEQRLFYFGAAPAPGQNLLELVTSLNDWFFSWIWKTFSNTSGEFKHLDSWWGRKEAGPLLLRPQTSRNFKCWLLLRQNCPGW